jgi:uncharacterized membrane protein (UPF0182 family)
MTLNLGEALRYSGILKSAPPGGMALSRTDRANHAEIKLPRKLPRSAVVVASLGFAWTQGDFYVLDPKDPNLAYQSALAGVFKNLDQLSQDLNTHLRYPEDLFAIQADEYKTFHIRVIAVTGDNVVMEPTFDEAIDVVSRRFAGVSQAFCLDTTFQCTMRRGAAPRARIRQEPHRWQSPIKTAARRLDSSRLRSPTRRTT